MKGEPDMKNFRTVRTLFALLLSLCMLFSGIPVLAQDGDYVTVTKNEDGYADVTVTVEEAAGDSEAGIFVTNSEDTPSIWVDGLATDEDPDPINTELWEDMDEQDCYEADSVTVNADSVSESVTLTPEERADYNEAEHLEIFINGVTAKGFRGTDVTVQIQENIDVSIDNKHEDSYTEEDAWCGDSVTAEGIYLESERGDSTISAEDVNVNLTYTDTDPVHEEWIVTDLVGIEAYINSAYDQGEAPEETAKSDIDVGNVTVTAESDAARPTISLRGIDVNLGQGAGMELKAGEVTVSANAEGEDYPDEEMAKDTQGDTDGLGPYGTRTTAVSLYGDVTAVISDVTSEAVSEGENLHAEATGIHNGGEENELNASNVTVIASSEGIAVAHGIITSGGASTAADEVSVTAKGENAYVEPAIQAEDSASVETGKVTAEAIAEEQAVATAVYAQDSYAESSGDVEATAQGGSLANATAIQAVGDAKVVAKGDVTAEAEATDEQGESHAVAIQVGALDNTVTTVIADGDVSAEADDGTGILIKRGESPEPEESEEAPTVNVIADGTVSGSTVAIELIEDENLTAEDVNLTVWAAEENEEEQIAVVRDEENNIDEAASKALEEAINYIIRFTESLTFDDISTEKGNEVEFLDRTYHTANEGEDVMVQAEDTDEKELAGIFYNADEESSLQDVKDLEKDENGNYKIRMERGGAMNLGLKWHTHVYEDRERDKVKPTCTKDGSVTVSTVCAECGKVAVTVTKTLPKTGHTPKEAVKENETAATCKAGGSYDLVTYCETCGEELSRETIKTDKLEHVPGEPVKENETAASCEADGSYDLVTYCEACGEEISRETIKTDKLEHVPGEPVKENEVPATEDKDGSYDLVTYCTLCGKELSRETVTVRHENNGSNNGNGGHTATTDLKVVRVEADEDTNRILAELSSAEETGDALAALPEDIREKIPEEFVKVIARDSMKITGDTEDAVSLIATLEYDLTFTEGETVYLLIGFPTGAEKTTKWFVLKGTGHADGTVTVNLTSLLDTLGNRPFTAFLIGK